MTAKTDPISLEQVQYYFDSMEQDRYDKGAFCRKNGQWLALREKLMKMPEERFDVTLKTIQLLIENATAEETLEKSKSSSTKEEKQAMAKKLFKATQAK